MEFLAESIGLLDIGGSSGDVSTPKNKSTNNTSFSSIISIDVDRRQSPGGGLKSSPQKKSQECDACSKKTFNLALENLSDRESCCRCDCQRSYDNQTIDEADEDFDEGSDLNADDSVESDEINYCNEEESSAIQSKSQPTPNHNSTATDGTQLTRLVTQRIDARTNYNCFTGNVDAVTGEIIHGTLVYRITGEVYKGPFLSVPRQNNQNQLNVSNHSEGGSADNLTTEFETVSLRHGSNATTHFPNGLTFTGTYELDHPIFGTWIMKDNDGMEEWRYEGPLIVVGADDTNAATVGRSSSATSISVNSPPSSGNLTTASLSTNRAIGTSNPLPGSVLFHGNGTFTRHSDGMRYKGEFDHGLAHGVGKEITPNVLGDGESVYQGEFANGFRHGVGTLIEDVVMGDDEGDEYCEQCNRMLLATDEGSDTDNGPDFAAGGSNMVDENHLLDDQISSQGVDEFASRQIQTLPCSVCVEHTASRRTNRKQRYSSGVWCAGQFEIQDVVGTVRHTSDGNKEFVEDSTPSVMSAGTTWDLLPEKWLGLV